MSSRFLTAAIAVVAALAGLALASVWLKPGTVEIQSGTLLQQRRALPEFALQGDNGQPLTKAALQGHWTLVFPGYTSCPDVCPTTLALLKALDAKLRAEGATPPQMLFLSVDPGRDTPQRLAQYVHYFNPAFTAATAQEPQLADFTRALGIAYTRVPSSSAGGYTMDHTAALVLIDPQARLTAFFTPPHKIEVMASDLQRLMGAAS